MKIFVGFDQREAVAYHTFCQSVLEHINRPVSFHPLIKRLFDYTDGSNAFTLSRYLVPYFCDFNGWALYADSDMIARCDLSELWTFSEENFHNIAVAVVKHDYRTKHPRKYLNTAMESDNPDYPRKNWSSLMLWNCNHFANRVLEPHFVAEHGGKFLHRFEWLMDEQIASLPDHWNHLVGEQEGEGKIEHYTLGIPAIRGYSQGPQAALWHRTLISALQSPEEDPLGIVETAISY